ncbi:MAG: GAF domain-containing protein [Anaerolineales bacterium]
MPAKTSTVPGTVLKDETFRALVEMTSAAVFVFRGTRLIYVNPAAEKVSGYSRSELLKMNFYDLAPAGNKKSIRNWALDLQRGEEVPTRGVIKIHTRQGEERWLDMSMGRMMLEGEQVGYGTALDVTEQKRAELLQDAVYRIAQAADQTHNLNDLYAALHQIIAEVMPAKNFYIALYDASEDILSFPYYVDEYDQPAPCAKAGKGLTEYLLRTGKSLLCDPAVHQALEASGEIELVGTPSPIWLGVPLVIGNQVIGAMVVQDYHDPGAFGEREQRILEFVSFQVAMAIQRKRAEDALRENEARIRRRADELTALYETTREITTAQRDIEALMHTIVERTASLLGVAGCCIYLYDHENNRMELMVAHGYQGRVSQRFPAGEGLIGQVAQTCKPVIVDDLRLSAYGGERTAEIPITAAMAAPMLYSNELIGAILVYEVERPDGSTNRLYGQAELDLLNFFAGAAAGAVHNARLFDETRQRLIELEVLYQASLAAAQIHSVKAVAQRIVDALGQLLRWTGSIWVNDQEHQRPLMLAYCNLGLTGEAWQNEFVRVSNLITSYEDGIIGWVCKNGHAIRTGDVRAVPYYTEATPETRSELCVPLKVGGKIIGCINVESPEPNAFSEHDERLLITIANQAAVAIENARLFGETRRRAIRQAALNTIITAAARPETGLESLLEMALDQLLQALGLDSGAMWLGWSPFTVQRVVTRGVPLDIHLTLGNAAADGHLDLEHPLVVADWSKEHSPPARFFVSIGVRASIFLPLQTGSTCLGGLMVNSATSRAWTTDDVTFAQAVAQEICASTERSRLFEETRARLAELESINRISTAFRLAKSLDEMMPELLDETLKALEAEAGGIWLYDSRSEVLKQVIGRGWCTQISHLELRRGESIPGSVFETGDIYFSADVAADALTPSPLRGSLPARWHAVCVPIRAEQETIGAFLVSTPGREFESQDARLLVTLAEIAGNTIQRMRLYEQTQRHAIELEERVAERTTDLIAALRKAQEADRLKSEFIANVNHELRTPLTNLLLYYQMLRAQPNVKTEERLDVIGRELSRLRILIEDLLNLSRMDLGQVTPAFKPQDLNALIRTLVDDRRSLAEERGLTLEMSLRPDLPLVWLDESMMVQAVSNLLTNALNYTLKGGRVSVRTAVEQAENEMWASFCVEDTGLGISEEDLPHLFERFYRGKAGHESGAPGTGLGLAIVKQVVEMHRGRIEVSAGEGGRGARFTVYLPLAAQG